MKAILGYTAALCVPLAMMANDSKYWMVVLYGAACGSVGYLANGWRGVVTGASTGLLVWFAFVVFVHAMGLTFL